MKTTDELLEGAPFHSVYSLRDPEGRLLWVGRSHNVRNRLGDHLRAEYGQHIDAVEVVGGLTAQEARLLEGSIIRTEQPLLNKQMPSCGAAGRICVDEWREILRLTEGVETPGKEKS